MKSKKIWNEGMVREFGLHKPLMWSVGIWPLETSKSFAHFRFFFAVIMESLMIINIFVEISWFNEASIETAVDYLALLACAMLGLVKILVIRLHHKDLLENMVGATDDWMFVEKHEHRRIMLDFAGISRTLFFIQIGSCCFVSSTMIISSFLPTEVPFDPNNGTLMIIVQELPYGSDCIYTENSTLFCKILYFSQSVELLVTLAGNIGCDVFLFGIAMHLCGQLDILIRDFTQFSIGSNVTAERRKEMVVKIKRHNLLLNLAQHMEDTLYIMLLIQLFLNAIDICLLGVQLIISMNIGNYVLTARTMVAFSVIMLQLFLYSYIGESLSSKMETIITGIYMSDWYTFPTIIVKDLVFIMARAGIPFHITAGKFYVMDINGFKDILKASMSYFSILRLALAQ